MSDADLETLVARLRGRTGLCGPTIVRSIETGALVKYAAATGQTDPLYIDAQAAAKGRFGAIIAAPTYLSSFTNEALVGVMVSDTGFDMFLHTDDGVESFVPIRAGDTIAATACYADAFVKSGGKGPRLFQIAEMRLTNQKQQLVATVRVGMVSFDRDGATVDG
ncbi:hypothetical protein BH10PSE13_BH10PSE13_04770 [soil metagenome]